MAQVNESGIKVEGYIYDAYGKHQTFNCSGGLEVRFWSTDGFTIQGAGNYGNPYTFTGRRFDPETDLPNSTVLAEKVVSPAEIILGSETKIAFDDPFYAEGNQSYAVVLLTNSTQYRVRVATLGGMGRNGIITSQTYAEGVLLESSNAETWTPLNGSDLAMRIYGYDFQNTGVIQFLPVTGQQFSDLNMDEYSSIPEDCSIV